MNDVNKFLSRGLTYAYEAADNWGDRRMRLISLWSKERHDPISHARAKKAYFLIRDLEDRVREIAGMIGDIKQRQREEEMHARHALIIYECADEFCGFESGLGTSLAIEAKDYDPEKKYTCPICGGSMACEADKFLNFLTQ